jgi:hypothetical protein
MIHPSFFLAPAAVAYFGVSSALTVLRWLRWTILFQDNDPEKRAVVLLRSWLTQEQDKQWATRGEFEVIGCDTGTRYRLTSTPAMNVHQLDAAGRTITKWCFMPFGGLVLGDMLLAQKIALETMEREVLTLANRQPSRLV